MKYRIKGAKVAPPLRAPDPDTESMVSQQRLTYSNFPDAGQALDGHWNLKEDYEQMTFIVVELLKHKYCSRDSVEEEDFVTNCRNVFNDNK